MYPVHPALALHVRAATLLDAPTLVTFNRAMALETESKHLDEERVTRGVHGLLSQPSRGFYLVAEVQGQIAGQLMVTYEWSDWRDGTFWWIQSVYVAPHWRRQGVYRHLYAWLLAHARTAEGVCGVRLYVDHFNHVAKATYEALGMGRAHYELFEVDFVLGEAPGAKVYPNFAIGGRSESGNAE